MDNLPKARPLIVGVGGLTSEVGKTTLLCDLLRAFPGWEAIKTTRGHYRSCGKDPQACCVSHLLEDKAVVRTGRELTYTSGKDTGRYWDAGAANVHWVIATTEQVESGIQEALSRVNSLGVFVEGNSFTRFVQPDYFVMVARSGELKMKPTARKALEIVSACYVSGEVDSASRTSLAALLQSGQSRVSAMPDIFEESELDQLISNIRDLRPSIAA